MSDSNRNPTPCPPNAVIIPAYNESKTIYRVISGAKKHLPDSDILVVDDGSKDLTMLEARAAGATVIPHGRNMGYVAALKTGYKYALYQSYSVFCQMDADGQHDPSFLPHLVREISSHHSDVVVGSRFLGNSNYHPPALRRMGMAVFARTASRMCGKEFTDTTSGFRAMNRRAVQFLLSPRFPSRYPDANYAIAFHRARFCVREIPVDMNPSLNGKSMHRTVRAPFHCAASLFNILKSHVQEKCFG